MPFENAKHHCITCKYAGTWTVSHDFYPNSMKAYCRYNPPQINLANETWNQWPIVHWVQTEDKQLLGDWCGKYED